MKKKVITVVGARPHFVKCSVVSACLAELGDAAPYEEVMVHTGQHYDPMLSEVFFNQLKLPDPKYNLDVGSVPTNIQAAKVLERLTPVFEKELPDGVLVYGDTVSTLAAAFAAASFGIPVAHVEAGERLYRRENLPEELNRILTDHTASVNFTCTERAARYLEREGISPSRIRFTGDPMFDLFKFASARSEFAHVSPSTFGVKPSEYYLSTIHRKENTSDVKVLLEILQALDLADLPVILPIHPRVKNILANESWAPTGSLNLIDPLSYFDFIRMLMDCKLCITDSGGAVKEAFFAKKPAIVPMPSTAWPDVVDAGWIRCVGNRKEDLLSAISTFRAPDQYPEGLFGDGYSARKIVSGVAEMLSQSIAETPWHRRATFSQLPKSNPTMLSVSNYEAMLSCLKDSGYRFVDFSEAEALEPSASAVVLRHDVDIELESAVEMAKVEMALGVKSTYFFLTSSDHYNPFSKAGSNAIRTILSYGHKIGLHFDPAAYDTKDLVLLSKKCDEEASLLENWFQEPIDTVSFHRPTLAIQSAPEFFGNRRHTYSSRFTKAVFYVSDSRGEWAYGHPLNSEAYANKSMMQILVHPIWWRTLPVQPYEALASFMDRHIRKMEQSLAENCVVFRVGDLRQ